ncbi:MAG TPA: chemotaxis protein CheW, partial [Ktedonobacterales bacterium]|nr:chemotaxis protein CheW [Ktedonobacterales bacterium]
QAHESDQSDARTRLAPLGGAGESLTRTLWSGETEALLRVDIQRLDDLMNRLSGLAINRATLTQARDDILRVQNEMEVALQRLATMSAQITDLYPFTGLPEPLDALDTFGARAEVRQGSKTSPGGHLAERRAGAFGGAGGMGVFRPSGWLAVPPPHEDLEDDLEHERYTEFDHALRALGEVVADVSALNMTLRTLLVRLGQISETQEGLMFQMQRDALQMRLVPLAELAPRLQLAARVLAADLGKSVSFTLRGEMTEIDRNISEALAEPLLQLVRNAIVHGIETPEERLERGKSETGAVWLHAYYVGNEVTIEIGDDGRGVNLHLLIASAIALGLIDHEQAQHLSVDEAYALMFRPGVSTMGEQYVMGGSGIGLDEVDVAIRAIKGTIQAQSEPGRGTMFRIRAPISLSIVRALHIVAAGQSYAAPFSSVQRTATIAAADLLPSAPAQTSGWISAPGLNTGNVALRRVRLPRGSGALALGSQPGLESVTTFGVIEPSSGAAPDGQTTSETDTTAYDEIPVFALAELLGYEHHPHDPELALIVEVGQQRVALLIDEARDDMEVVVRALPRHLRRRAIRGATVLPSGQTLLLLDLPELLTQRLAGAYTPPRPRPAPSRTQAPAPRVLI